MSLLSKALIQAGVERCIVKFDFDDAPSSVTIYVEKWFSVGDGSNEESMNKTVTLSSTEFVHNEELVAETITEMVEQVAGGEDDEPEIPF